ncbi:MAG: metallophosphoesterase [Planctomycetes bacterium]|nr:metallophosphoesterase [Planctomycetota bacterium]
MLRSLIAVLGLLMQAGMASAQIERIWLSHRTTAPSHVVVSWETAQPGDSVVHYGNTPAVQHTRGIEERVTLHHVEIPLDPTATAHHYRVQTGTHTSPVAFFQAYPADELRVAVIANLQSKPDLTALLRDRVHVVMTAGDNIPNLWQGGDGARPYSKLIDAYPELFRTTIFMPVLGNHDKEIRPRGSAPPQEPVYDVNATAFRTFFELPGDEWKWHFDVPGFDVRFIALDLNHISDMGTTWQTCHPFAAGSEQFQWYDDLTSRTRQRFVVTLYNERNVGIRTREGGRWHQMSRIPMSTPVRAPDNVQVKRNNSDSEGQIPAGPLLSGSR